MSLLNVQVINRTTDEIVNDPKPYILADESLHTVKEKLFAFTEGIDYYPPLLHIESDYSENEQSLNNRLYITNIFDVIEMKYNIPDVYMNSTAFDDTYNELHKTFIDLTEEDLEFVIKLIMVKTDDIIYKHLQNDVEEYIDKILEKQIDVFERYKRLQSNLERFYETSQQLSDFSGYWEIEENDMPTIDITQVAFTIKGKTLNGAKGKYIKLLNVFNQLELSEDMPFAAIILSEEKTPLIKVYNALAQTLSEKDIKSWIINEKKKQNLITFKKFKGLYLKYKIDAKNYLSINVHENGTLTVKISFTEESTEASFDDIMKIVKENVDKVIDNINKLQGVFVKAKRIDTIQDSIVSVENISGTVTTKVLIDKRQFTEILHKTYISEYVFDLKDTISDDFVSMYYKKITGKDSEDGESERKGITVSIRDNPYKLDSSIISVYGAYNVQQINIICKQIVILMNAYGRNTPGYTTKQKLKEKSHIKNLRKQGVDILSTKCQKPRQPDVNSEKKPLQSSYILEYKNIKYVCPSKNYPYPGFTNENIVCCFKKDQRKRPGYIRNTQVGDYDITVQPSNFSIKVTRNSKDTISVNVANTFSTYVVKVVSDYVDGFDETNSMSRYYYISENNTLEAITNQKLIEEIEQEEENNIWLDTMPLSNIITEPPKNKCNFPPNMNNKSAQDIHAPCKHHARNKFFGYNLNSYPCCFDKERDIYVNRKRKVSDITKQHILTSDKILDYQRIGVLPSGLDKLFNTVIESATDGKFYRMGVVQNKSAFLNAILLACENKVNDKVLNNSVEFRKYIANYLASNKQQYETLNMGNTSLKFGSIDKYIQGILDADNKFMSWLDYLDIVSRVIEKNIIMLDIPYKASESTKIADYENIKIICTPQVKINTELPFIVLLKRIKTFEVIVHITQADNQGSIQYTFTNDSRGTIKSNIINFLLSYHESSCVREDVLPETFPFDKLLTAQEVITTLSDSPHKITGQIINAFNKVVYLVSQRGVLIPVKEGGILTNLKQIPLVKYINSGRLLSITDYINEIASINETLQVASYKLQVTGATTDENKDGRKFYTAVFTNFGQLVPVAKTQINSKQAITLLNFKYYPEIDDTLLKESSSIVNNKEQSYNTQLKTLKMSLHTLKVALASALSNNIRAKTNILDINTNPSTSRFDKAQQIIKILKTFVKKSDSQTTFFLHIIANDIINDNVENLLLNNLVISDVYNPEEVVKRENESLVANLNDLRKWFKRHNTEE